MLWTEPAAAHAQHAHYVLVAVERGIEKSTDQGGDRAGNHRSELWRAGVLTYGSPGPIAPGARVEVPLGRGDRSTEGLVVDCGGPELLGDYSATKIKSVIRVLGTGGVPPALVELAKWMSGYYVCPIGMVLATMIPSAVKRAVGSRSVRMIAPGPGFDLARVEAKLAPSAEAMWELARAIGAGDWPLTPDRLLIRTGQKNRRAMNALIVAGVLEAVSVDEVHSRGGAPIGNSIETGGTPADDQRGAASPTLTPQQSVVVNGLIPALGSFGVHLLRGVTGSGKTEVYLRVIEHLLTQRPDATALMLVPEISLTPQIGGRFQQRLGRFGHVAVLHSGLSASQRHKQWQLAARGAAGGAGAKGGARVVVGARSAIFAPLTNVGMVIVDEEHASDYKQDQLPRYHGRDVAIKRAQIEQCPVLLGSATPSLESWANAIGEQPKYRLWELTERVAGARLPKVEIVDLALERKALDQRRRAHARASPPLSSGPADTTHPHPPTRQAAPARAQRPSMLELGEMIGPTLERALAQTLEAGAQAVLLLNRRGYSGYIACADANCGWVMRCDDCDAGMVFHKHIALAGDRSAPGVSAAGTKDGSGGGGGVQSTIAGLRRERLGSSPRVVRCHHCLAQQLMPGACPSCGKGLVWLGLGTQRVEEEVAEKFGALIRTGPPGGESAHASTTSRDWVVRVDGDTMNSARDHFDVLGRFAAGQIRVLVGTQMIAKGLDFPNVRLVGVINADTALGLADFRSTERTFQLVSQVAGRAGRTAAAPGRVVVQTFEPTSPAIRFAAEHDFRGFAAQELEVRWRSGLPPATRMARIVVRDEVFERAMKAGARIADELRRAAGNDSLSEGGVRVIGPLECPIARIARQYRVGIELTALRRGSLQSVLSAARARGFLKSDSQTAVDIDPIALL